LALKSFRKGPLSLMNFTLPWSEKFKDYDVFLDNFSNLLVLHHDGCFVIYEQLFREKNSTKNPEVYNLSIDE
jgi:hypothetical protein